MSTMTAAIERPVRSAPIGHGTGGTGTGSSLGNAAPGADRRLDSGLALLRAAVGAIFLAHGAQKIFVYGFAGVIGAFEGMGIPLAGITAPAVALLELLGGLALIAGLFTRWVGIGLAVNMLGALFLVHLPAGFFLPNGIEFVLALFAAAATLALTGPGAFSVDAVVGRRRARL